MNIPITQYSSKEEKLNILSHQIGLILSIAGLVLLVVFSSIHGTAWHIVSFSIFGASLVTLYLASTLYHAARKQSTRRKLNIFDHAAIYLLIAGTYTPFCLAAMHHHPMGWVLFGLTWLLALTGMTLKIFFTGRFELVSTITYVVMGWLVVIAINPLIDAVPFWGLIFLLLGGVSYTIGSVFYSISKIPYNHAIFHIWVLAGSTLHFISVCYLL